MLFPQSSGIIPVAKILLKTIVKYGLVNSEVHLKNSAGRPSGPGALFACNREILCLTSSSVIKLLRSSELLSCLIPASRSLFPFSTASVLF